MTAKKNNKRIKSTEFKKDGKIPSAKNVLEEIVSFSFKYTKMKKGKFDYTEQKSKYFISLIDRLCKLSSMTIKELKVSRSSAIRFNPIQFDKDGVTENGFDVSINNDDVLDESYEFAVSANKHGRCHGFFIDKIFYIVWFDPQHRLMKSKNHMQ